MATEPVWLIHKMRLARQNSQLFYEAWLHLATRKEPTALALHQGPHFLSAAFF
jgi:hypothetical protein